MAENQEEAWEEVSTGHVRMRVREREKDGEFTVYLQMHVCIYVHVL